MPTATHRPENAMSPGLYHGVPPAKPAPQRTPTPQPNQVVGSAQRCTTAGAPSWVFVSASSLSLMCIFPLATGLIRARPKKPFQQRHDALGAEPRGCNSSPLVRDAEAAGRAPPRLSGLPSATFSILSPLGGVADAPKPLWRRREGRGQGRRFCCLPLPLGERVGVRGIRRSPKSEPTQPKQATAAKAGNPKSQRLAVAVNLSPA